MMHYSMVVTQLSQSTFQQEFLPQIRGTIIPKEWKQIVTPQGKKLSRGSLELYAVIVSWFRSSKIKDKITGQIKLVSKFEGDELRKNYDYFTKELDRSQEQLRRYFVELKAADLIAYEVRTVTHGNWKYHNTLCIRLNKNAPHFLKEAGLNKSEHKADHINYQSTPQSQKIEEVTYSSCNTDLCTTSECSDVTEDTKDKKIWSMPHQKVVSSPQKSGASYIEDKISLKTNIKLDLIDLGESNFLKKNKNSLQCNLSEFEKEIMVGGSFPSASFTRTPIARFYPVSEQDAFYLQKASSRDFSTSYINKLLLKLIDIKPDHGFYTKDLFLSYMSKALSNELRNPTQTNNVDFNFAMPKEVRVVENYLNDTESSCLTDNITRLKKKIIGSFHGIEAYSILTNLTFDHSSEQITQTVKVSRSSLHSNTRSSFALSKERQDVITRLVLEVFGQSTDVVFDFEYETQSSQNFKKSAAAISSQNLWQVGGDYHALPNTCFNPDNQHSVDAISEPTTFEQKVLSLLKQSYGNTIYKSWFSSLKVSLEDIDTSNTADQNNSSIACGFSMTKVKVSIITPTAFMRDYIKTNYGYKIESVIGGLLEKVDQRLSREGVIWV